LIPRQISRVESRRWERFIAQSVWVDVCYNPFKNSTIFLESQ
jgi:hypothetical protein